MAQLVLPSRFDMETELVLEYSTIILSPVYSLYTQFSVRALTQSIILMFFLAAAGHTATNQNVDSDLRAFCFNEYYSIQLLQLRAASCAL